MTQGMSVTDIKQLLYRPIVVPPVRLSVSSSHSIRCRSLLRPLNPLFDTVSRSGCAIMPTAFEIYLTDRWGTLRTAIRTTL